MFLAFSTYCRFHVYNRKKEHAKLMEVTGVQSSPNAFLILGRKTHWTRTVLTEAQSCPVLFSLSLYTYFINAIGLRQNNNSVKVAKHVNLE